MSSNMFLNNLHLPMQSSPPFSGKFIINYALLAVLSSVFFNIGKNKIKYT